VYNSRDRMPSFPLYTAAKVWSASYSDSCFANTWLDFFYRCYTQYNYTNLVESLRANFLSGQISKQKPLN
jgi:hypothetical protein